MKTQIFLSNHTTARIMRRVYLVWFLRKITSPLFVRFYIMALILLQLFRSVSIIDILQNIARVKLGDTANYFLVSFAQTEPAVQVYVTLFTVLCVWVAIKGRLKHIIIS